jgi:hypothetical protein
VEEEQCGEALLAVERSHYAARDFSIHEVEADPIPISHCLTKYL